MVSEQQVKEYPYLVRVGESTGGYKKVMAVTGNVAADKFLQQYRNVDGEGEDPPEHVECVSEDGTIMKFHVVATTTIVYTSGAQYPND